MRRFSPICWTSTKLRGKTKKRVSKWLEKISNRDFYKTPSDEVLRHRREFYSLRGRSDDQTISWLERVQSQINRCAFPLLMSPEYLLIDKFVCSVNEDERELIRCVDASTIWDLFEYLFSQTNATDNFQSNGANAIDERIQHNQDISHIVIIIIGNACN